MSTAIATRARISKSTRLCMSLSGRPGNFGTRFQNHLYEAMDLDFVYKAFTTTDLPAAIGGIRALGIRGCAVSMPFKEACIPLLDDLDPSAAVIGSVNTIVNDDGRLRGFNTDYIAIRRLITGYGVAPDTRTAIRGSGGMAEAVANAFRDSGFRDVILVARNQDAGAALAGQCGFRWQAEPTGLRADLLVNVTPLGMAGGPDSDVLAFPEPLVDAARVVFDVVAVPVETPLIRLARARNRTVINGGEVLVLQGAEQFALYTGRRPSEPLLAEAAAVALA